MIDAFACDALLTWWEITAWELNLVVKVLEDTSTDIFQQINFPQQLH